jgi:hypothetical protein
MIPDLGCPRPGNKGQLGRSTTIAAVTAAPTSKKKDGARCDHNS